MDGVVLGLGGSNHDFSAVLVRDGRVIVGVEDERLQRQKRGHDSWHAQPARDATRYCLRAAGIDVDDLDGIFCCDDLERPTDWLDWSQVTFVNHHTAHASAAYYSHPHESATLLVIDGHGSPVREIDNAYEVETISIGRAVGSTLSLSPHQTGRQMRSSSSWRYVAENSIGWFYKIVSMAIGFGAAGQGKAMGLAAYGSPSLVDELGAFVELRADGRFTFDPYAGIWDWLTEILGKADGSAQVKADLAYAAQEILVDAVVAAAREAHRQAPSDVLAFGGGCALNTLANSRILERTPFQNLCVHPAAGDNGLAVGAAFYGAHALQRRPRSGEAQGWRGRMVFVGREYADSEIEDALRCAPVLVRTATDLPREIACLLASGRTVAVCRGGSEIGPRALGHRSLLALPGPVGVRDQINLNVKRRESFRPLAPVVPIEDVETYFDGVDESPHMLLVATVRPKFREQLAAVTHVDGTARVQTVRAEDEPFLHRLLELIGDLTGIPVLLNTSLNLPDKPIVETPADAVALFVQRPIDALVLGNRIVTKFTPWVPAEVLPASLGSLNVGTGAPRPD
jgi:carbamoyltransferase